MPTPNTLRAGSTAFLDTFSGLVPCRVLTIQGDPRPEAKVLVTRTIKAYRKGEQVTMDTAHVIPSGALGRRGYATTILPYNIEVTQ